MRHWGAMEDFRAGEDHACPGFLGRNLYRHLDGTGEERAWGQQSDQGGGVREASGTRGPVAGGMLSALPSSLSTRGARPACATLPV